MNTPLITQKTTLQRDLDEKDASVIRCAEALHHAASVLAEENLRFWEVPTDRLLAVLNHDIAATLATFAANSAVGLAINAQLDALALPQLPRRAPVEPGRTDIVLQDGQYVHVPPVPVPAEPGE